LCGLFGNGVWTLLSNACHPTRSLSFLQSSSQRVGIVGVLLRKGSNPLATEFFSAAPIPPYGAVPYRRDLLANGFCPLRSAQIASSRRGTVFQWRVADTSGSHTISVVLTRFLSPFRIYCVLTGGFFQPRHWPYHLGVQLFRLPRGWF
jgi:hypothetical protein